MKSNIPKVLRLVSIKIIATTYSGHTLEQLRCFVSSLQCQSLHRGWNCSLVCDGTYDSNLSFEDIYDELNLDDRFSWIEVEKKGSYGHYSRRLGVIFSEHEWFHTTNADNIYFPNFIQDFTDLAKDNPECDLLMFPIVHNYAHGNHYGLLDPLPQLDHVDFMNFIIKTELMREIGFDRWLTFTGADGMICSEALKLGAKWAKGRSIIGVHN